MAQSLHNMVHHAVEKYMAARYSERHGLVTSYNPKTHLAKVTFQPGGQESGWLPIETSHIGNGWGDVVGLTPGSGTGSGSASGSTGGSGSQQGDQVIVRGQEGDIESCKIAGRCHSDSDIPPVVQPGEMLRKHKMGAKMYLDGQGQVTLNDRTNDGSGFSNDFSDANSTGGNSGGFSPGSGLDRDGVQKPEKPQSISITMDGKGQYTKSVYDQTNNQQNQGTVQNAQGQFPPLAVTHVSSGVKGKGQNLVTTYRQGAQQQGGSSSGGQQGNNPPMPPPACHTSHGCDGTHKVQVFQNKGTKIGGQPPLATEHSSKDDGTIQHTTWYPGDGGGSGGGGTSSGGGTSGGGAGGSSGPDFGSAGQGPTISPSFQPAQAAMAAQVVHDGKGNTTITTFRKIGSNQSVNSSKVTMDGGGNMTHTTYDSGGNQSCHTSMDQSGNITLTGSKQGSITLNNGGGSVHINTPQLHLN